MEFRIGRTVHLYYLIVLFVAITGFATWFYIHWRGGSVNFDTIGPVLESYLKVEEIKDRKQLSQINSLVMSDKIRESVKLLDKLDKDVKRMNRTVKHFPDEYDELSDGFTKTKVILNRLLSLPDMSSVVMVLKDKIRNFESFVSNNRWPTLTRISRRLRANVVSINSQKPGSFDYYRMRNVHKNFAKNIKSLKHITRSSLLSSYDKNLIMLKLNTFGVELNMLKKYLPELSKFNEQHKELMGSFDGWMRQIGPEISIKKMEFEKNIKQMFFTFLVMMFLLITAFIGGFFVYRKEVEKGNLIVEETVLEAIKMGIVPSESKFKKRFSDKFYDEFNKYHDWFKNRMSFGQIFQETTPFPSILLDSNLNLIWANSLFYEKWNLEDYKNRYEGGAKREELNWEFLQRFTNLGEDDPVTLALNSSIAGIYQIQIKQKGSDSIPYEMYVSPIDCDNQIRIMIFFYPLTSLEATINSQKKSLIGPVARSLDALITDGFNGDFKERVKEDFLIAGIDELFGKFVNFNEFVTKQKSGLLDEIERLENDICDRHKLLCDVREHITQKNDLVVREIQNFQNTRDAIVSLVDLRKSVEQLYLNTITTSKIMFKEEVELVDQSACLGNVLEEHVKIFKSVSASKENFKELISTIDHYKTRVSHIVDQTMIFTKTNNMDPDKVTQSLGQVKLEMRGLERELAEFGKTLTGFDVLLSKMQMILDDVKRPEIVDFKRKVELTRDRIETDMFNMGLISKEGTIGDERIIDLMKVFYQNITDSKESLKKINTLLSDIEIDVLENENDDVQYEDSGKIAGCHV
ncbi:MAG: hypothetical protein KAQ98_11280 [Bacteriovoracaceae bacterium]|nr:hypothetical protein [Bacteriovoracaceae bacterium]